VNAAMESEEFLIKIPSFRSNFVEVVLNPIRINPLKSRFRD
jgi:hypothetical protein